MTARNSVGTSTESEILTVLGAKVPDAPINLQNVPSITTGYQIGLTWQAGNYNGGSPVIDYQVSYSVNSSSSYEVYSDSFTPTSITITGLTPGTTYNIVVKSRNLVGRSPFSTSLSVLAA